MLETLTTKIAKSASGKKGFGKAILLDLGADGAIRIDGTGDQATVSNDAETPADTTIAMSAETLDKLMTGQANPAVAVMTGKIKIKGDTALALKLASFL